MSHASPAAQSLNAAGTRTGRTSRRLVGGVNACRQTLAAAGGGDRHSGLGTVITLPALARIQARCHEPGIAWLLRTTAITLHFDRNSLVAMQGEGYHWNEGQTTGLLNTR
jgi:hypothetical protein